MANRIPADENVERATVNYLRKLGHDVDRVDDIAELGSGAVDGPIARHAREHDRLILTQDDDFFTELDIGDTAGVRFHRDQTLSTREVGTPFTRWHSPSTSPTWPSNTSAGAGCEERGGRAVRR